MIRVREEMRMMIQAGVKMRVPGPLLICALALVFAAGCAGVPPGSSSGDSAGGEQPGGAADVHGFPFLDREWKLTAVRAAGRTTAVDRARLEAAGMGEFFSLTFGPDRLSGIAAPNRYNAPYRAGPVSRTGGPLSIGLMVSTKMFLFNEPGPLTEQAYFHYLEKVTRWARSSGRLELYTTGPDGTEAALVYGQ